MAQSIGPKGRLEVQVADLGAQRPLTILHFYGRADTGYIDMPFLQAGNPPKVVLDMNDGTDKTAAFGGVVTGGFSQTDTGVNALIDGHSMLALVTDTGTAGV